MSTTTQEHLPISEIKQDLVIQKTGDVAIVLQTSAVNFGLLSEQEQIAIIGSFAGMLNSLSYPIEIVIHSKRLNIASYLEKLDKMRIKQQNPLLATLMLHYRNFVERVIRENEVLDKQFYVIIPLQSYEIGLLKSSPNFIKKALTTLIPRRDHLIRQLARVGLIAKQLTSVELINLFYDIYNNQPLDTPNTASVPKNTQPTPSITPALNKPTQTPAPSTPRPAPPPPTAPAPLPINAANSQPLPPKPSYPLSPSQPPTPQFAPIRPAPPANGVRVINHNTPFVVEELKDEYGTV